MEPRQQLIAWRNHVDAHPDATEADMDVAKRLLKHGLDAYDEVARLRRALDDLGVTPAEARAGAERSKAKDAEIARLRDENAGLRKDAERLDWMEREAKKSSHAVQFRLLRDPAINAGMNRIECTTTVGGGPWQRDVEGPTLRAAIDAAMRKGE